MKGKSKAQPHAPTLTEADIQEALDAIRRSSTEELLEGLADVIQIEESCRATVGIPPAAELPFCVNPFAEFWLTAIPRELDLRDHDYVEQGNSYAMMSQA